MGNKGGVLRIRFLQGLESLLFGVESTIYHLQRSLMQRLQEKHGSMAKGFRPLKDYYPFVLESLWEGRSHEQIETALSQNEKYRRLVKEKPTLTRKPKKFSRGVKQFAVIAQALLQASHCELCSARIGENSYALFTDPTGYPVRIEF